MTTDVELTLLPLNRILKASIGKRLSDVIRHADLPLGFSCGGRGVCIACVVHTRGEFSKVTEREQNLLDTVPSPPDGWVARISCLTRLHGHGAVRTTYW